LPNLDGWLLLADVAPIERLEPWRRAAVLMTLVGLVILGMGMVFLIVVGARWARRMIRRNRTQGSSDLTDNWWEKPLVPPLEDEPSPPAESNTPPESSDDGPSQGDDVTKT
jgi:hypothetical protein